jgi:hypothetical protein
MWVKKVKQWMKMKLVGKVRGLLNDVGLERSNI